MNSDLIQPQRHRKSLLRTPRAGVWLLFSLLAGTSAGFAADAASPPDAFGQNQRLGRGVNILGYDPIWRSREQARLQVNHFRLLHEAGFDSVRIGLGLLACLITTSAQDGSALAAKTNPQ